MEGATGADDVTTPWADDVGLAAALGDGVVVMAPGGTIVWANAAFARLVGRDLDDVVGTDGLGLVHPDELGRAMDGVVYVAQFPGRTSVAPYRIRHGDGRWVDIELKSGVISRHGEDHLVLAVRDGTTRQLVNQALASVANGEPLERTAELVTEVVTRRWTGTALALSLGQLDGTRVVHGSDLPPVLAEHALGLLPGAAAPWELGGDKVAVVDGTELTPVLREAAEVAGFEGFAVAQVEDPSGAPGCLLVWFDHTAIAHLEFTHAAAELTELLVLALERRLHLWQLWHVSSHDALTGVLNRSGFLARVDADVAATRAVGSAATAVLYLDLDGLKAVNDRDGHAAGDRLLVAAAGRLAEVVGERGVIGRLGGDEFVVSVALPRDEAAARSQELADDVVAALRIPVPAASRSGTRAGVDDLVVSASVGVVVDDGTDDPAHLLERADAAMYRAKSAGGSRWSS